MSSPMSNPSGKTFLPPLSSRGSYFILTEIIPSCHKCTTPERHSYMPCPAPGTSVTPIFQDLFNNFSYRSASLFRMQVIASSCTSVPSALHLLGPLSLQTHWSCRLAVQSLSVGQSFYSLSFASSLNACTC